MHAYIHTYIHIYIYIYCYILFVCIQAYCSLQRSGYFVGPGDNFGGDFTLYPGEDPATAHAVATVRIIEKSQVYLWANTHACFKLTLSMYILIYVNISIYVCLFVYEFKCIIWYYFMSSRICIVDDSN